jgi:hypothetical protein
MSVKVECKNCHRLITLVANQEPITELIACPDCEPDLYYPPSDVWPYWMHKTSEGSVTNITSMTVAELLDFGF